MQCAVYDSWNWLQELPTSAVKGIGTSCSMLVNHFKTRAIVGHRYPIVSIDFHEHCMRSMMVLKQLYALVIWPSDARKPCQGKSRSRDYVGENGVPAELRSVSLHWRGWSNSLGDYVEEKGRLRNGFVLVIGIARWNQMYIGSVP